MIKRCTLLALLTLLLTPTLHAQSGPTITNLTSNTAVYPDNTIPQYQKLELTFNVNTAATNPQWPYDANPPAGIQPEQGITVNAHFSPDGGQTIFIQPAFYYQEFETAVVQDTPWLHPTDSFTWKVRFAPHQTGTWNVYLTAQDTTGTTTTDPITFEVGPSDNHGFVRVSPTDSRYFTFDDGTYFHGLGFNATMPTEEEFQRFNDNGIQLIRTWLPSQLSIWGAAWNPWYPFGAAPLAPEPSSRLRHDAAPPFNQAPLNAQAPFAVPHSDLFLWLSHDETLFDSGQQWNFIPCLVWGWQAPKLTVQPNTDYRLQVRYRPVDVTGPKVAGQPTGFVVKTGGWLWSNDESQRCYAPNTGTPLAASYDQPPTPDPSHPEWQLLTATFNSGDAYFMDNLYLTLENANSGHILIDTIAIEAELDNGRFGPNIISRPWAAFHQYFDQRSSYQFDQLLEQAAAHDLYFKLVIMEKNDYSLNVFNPDGTMAPYQPGELFFGNGREPTKIRWLQQAWWRYLQARWAYSPHIHSWELLNEGNPNSQNHYLLADEMGRYLQTAFIPQGQTTPHPNRHLTTTSLWNNYAAPFWNDSASYPYVDYADIHHYAREGDPRPLDWLYEDGDFYDAAAFSQKLSLALGANQPDGPRKPLVRGETGFIFANNQDPFADNVTDGLWLHNFLWGSLNSGGLYELLWTGHPTQHHLWSDGFHDHLPTYRALANFLADIPLANGRYQDAAATTSNPQLRAWGQTDPAAGQAHLWLQNAQHTWKNVADNVPITAVSTTVTLPNLQANETYTVTWHPTRANQPPPRQETLTTNADGTLTLTITNLTDDIAVKIADQNPTPLEELPPVPTTTAVPISEIIDPAPIETTIPANPAPNGRNIPFTTLLTGGVLFIFLTLALILFIARQQNKD